MKTIRAKLLPLMGIMLSVFLAGCGQGNTASTDAGNPQEQSTQQNSQQTFALAAEVTGAPGIEIDNYTLVSSTRISRTVYEYIYKADVSNWGTGDAAITATLASNAAHITVMEGDLNFGDVIKGATEESTDTFTIRHDRSQPFDEDALVWTVQATPLAPTTFELIDKALADGVIDAETALVYKVFHEFSDDRLPAEYRGRDDGFFESVALQKAATIFNTLTPATQQILAPFLEFPDIDTVPLDPSGSVAGTLNYTPQSTAVAAAAPSTLTGMWIITGQVAILWHTDQAADLVALHAQMASRIRSEIQAAIWPRLTGLYGVPVAGKRIVILVNTTDPTVQGRSFAISEDCVTAEVVMTVDTKEIVAHELTHALLFLNYPNKCNAPEALWMHEATATWSQHYTYRNSNGFEHYLSPFFLDDPAASLNLRNDRHEYGAYLWFLYLTNGASFNVNGASAGAAPATWAAWNTQASRNTFEAIESGVKATTNKEMNEEWPQFALYNWNRVPAAKKPYRYYYQWDKLNHKARESTTALPASGQQLPKIVKLDGGVTITYGLNHLIRPLGAKYWHWDFRKDSTIRRVRLRHPYSDGTQPWAKVQVIVKLRNKEWMPAQDWTAFERKTLCRDKPDEDFQELVVIVSNSDVTDSHILSDINAANTAVDVSALGCSNWIGSVAFSVTGTGSDSSITETGEATNVTWEILSDRFSAQEYQLTGGAVQWRHSGSAGDCAGESEGGYTLTGSIAGVEGFAAFGGMYDKPAGATFAPGYAMWGVRYFGVTPPADYLCPDGSTVSPIPGHEGSWLDMTTRFINKDSPGLYDSDETGNTLMGSSIILENDGVLVKRKTYTWTFRKNGTYAGEPEL